MHDVFEFRVTANAPAFLGLFGVTCAAFLLPASEPGVKTAWVSVPVLALSQADQEMLRRMPGILSLRRLGD